MKKENIYQAVVFLIVLLWIYAGLSKLFNYELSKYQMLNQVFPKPVALIFTWLIPAIELVTGILLCIPKTFRYALDISFLLLTAFTCYILGGILNLYSRIPCTCGGIIKSFSWGWHLVFNLFFLGLNLYVLILHGNERRARQRSN
jgi:putative oxidoreductase